MYNAMSDMNVHVVHGADMYNKKHYSVFHPRFEISVE